MARVLTIALVLLAAIGAAIWYLEVLGPTAVRVDVAMQHFDTDASGSADLTRQRIGDAAVIWRWDRDETDDGFDLVAYDAAVNAEGQLRPTGSITAWDFGADRVLDEGELPGELRELLGSEEVQSALAMAGTGNVELVDTSIRALVEQFETRYNDWRLAGFRMPIVGAGLPNADRLLPGARRAYRYGIHQGFDMYDGYIGVPTGFGGPVVAAKDGQITRADVDYVEMTAEEHDEAIAISKAAGTTPPEQLDLLRGRQVWIDHGHGVISRYCHLAGIAPGIEAGQAIEAGTVIAFVGNSGMESASRGRNDGAHLHFEIRVDGRYLGEGMSPDEIRSVIGPILGVPDVE